ncbi:MAG TPA: CHAT domain-containing protein, partial [Verrucomicrobiota bacterium]|nr:CHAT domain-containing protein [Verrucomicrobiota bacterium]
ADLLIQLGRLPEAERVLVMLKEEEFSGFIRRDAGQVGPAAPMPKTSTEAGLMDRDASLAAQAAAVGVRWRELHEKGAARRTADENAEFRQLKERRENLAQNYNRFLAELRSELGTQREDKVREIAEAEALQSLLLEMRRSGAGEAAVLYTLVAETNYRVIVITADSTLDFKTPIAATNLNLKVAQFRNVLSDDRRLPDPLPAAQELYRIIFCNGDVDAALKAAKVETVMWSLDGTLRYLPMAALHDGKGYIAERYRNVVITPASIARLERKPQPSWAGLGLGVSKAHEVKLEHRPGNVERIKFSPLSEVPVELRGIIRDETVGSAGAVSGRIMLDGQFTEATLRDALEERYQLVHIASHFYFRPGDETSSFLLLGDGNPLNVSQLKNFRNLFESVNLLTLSACETAVGGADENDGANGAEVDSFGELAQRKGAAAIVATLWPVNDESTSLLMREFYRLRQTNPAWTKAEALRQAQLKLLRGNVKPTQSSTRRAAILADDPGAKPSPDFTHPYFWAPFVLTGNWQ